MLLIKVNIYYFCGSLRQKYINQDQIREKVTTAILCLQNKEQGLFSMHKNNEAGKSSKNNSLWGATLYSRFTL